MIKNYCGGSVPKLNACGPIEEHAARKPVVRNRLTWVVAMSR